MSFEIGLISIRRYHSLFYCHLLPFNYERMIGSRAILGISSINVTHSIRVIIHVLYFQIHIKREHKTGKWSFD